MAGTTSGVKITQNAGDINIILYQGKTVNFEVIWGGAAPIDVTGFSAKLQARKVAASVSPMVTFQSPSSGITVGGVNGKFIISMSATNTALLVADTGIYDLEITDGSGNVFQVMSGKFKIEAEATR